MVGTNGNHYRGKKLKGEKGKGESTLCLSLCPFPFSHLPFAPLPFLSRGADGALEGDFLEVGHALEVAEAAVDLLGGEALDALGAELLDVERSHHGAEDDGAAHGLFVGEVVAGEVAH